MSILRLPELAELPDLADLPAAEGVIASNKEYIIITKNDIVTSRDRGYDPSNGD